MVEFFPISFYHYSLAASNSADGTPKVEEPVSMIAGNELSGPSKDSPYIMF
jgi:hypothetical protein